MNSDFTTHVTSAGKLRHV